MYYCNLCDSYFDEAKIQFERHSLDTEPFEKHYVCPVCNSAEFKEINLTHCRCCGARLKENEYLYCSPECEERGKKMWEKQKRKKYYEQQMPLNIILRELGEYNRLNKTKLSYGQYVAIIGEKKKCKKKKTT